jgi:hypothetical protein
MYEENRQILGLKVQDSAYKCGGCGSYQHYE